MIEQHLPAMRAYALACIKGYSGEDARDLVQEACARLIAARYEKITEQLAITVVKNVWRDRCAMKATRKTYQLGDDALNAFVLPQVEEEIYCQQTGRNINDWPEKETKQINTIEVAQNALKRRKQTFQKFEKYHGDDVPFESLIKQKLKLMIQEKRLEREKAIADKTKKSLRSKRYNRTHSELNKR